MALSRVSFVSESEKLILSGNQLLDDISRDSATITLITAEILFRLGAILIYTPSAAFELIFHTVLLLPAIVYAIGKSLYFKRSDFSLPWEHLQRIRNAVSPLIFGSILSISHPMGGVLLTGLTDKRTIYDILSCATNRYVSIGLPLCSPIQTLYTFKEIIENQQIVHQIIVAEKYVPLIKGIIELEKPLELLTVQEYLSVAANNIFRILSSFEHRIEVFRLNKLAKGILIRALGLMAPAMLAAHLMFVACTQLVFLTVGVAQLLSGRVMYTEILGNPLNQVLLLIQNILNFVGMSIAAVMWFISPKASIKIKTFFSNLFTDRTGYSILSKIDDKIDAMQDREQFIIPILNLKEGEQMTYLIVNKRNSRWDLYWINQRKIIGSQNLKRGEVLDKITAALSFRAVFTPVGEETRDEIRTWSLFGKITANPPARSTRTFFGTLLFLDIMATLNHPPTRLSEGEQIDLHPSIKRTVQKAARSRRESAKTYLYRKYGFMAHDSFPFARPPYSFSQVWPDFARIE